MAKNVQGIVEELVKQFPSQVEPVEDQHETTIRVEAGQLVSVMRELKDNPAYDFKMLADLTAVENANDFEMVYHLMSVSDAGMLKVRVKLDKVAPRVPSLVAVWTAANVQERETYDLMGVIFEGHPNLKRILCPEDFAGHPLRKEYTLSTRN